MITARNGHHAPLSFNQLKAVMLTPPAGAGRRWAGVKHHVAANLFLKRLPNGSAPIYHVGDGGRDMLAGYVLPDVYSVGNRKYHHGAALLSSNGRHCRTRIYYGAYFTTRGSVEREVGVVLGEIVTTASLQNPATTPAAILDEACGVALEKRLAECDVVLQQLREKHIPSTALNGLILELGRQNLLPWSRVGEMDENLSGSTELTALDFLIEFARWVQMSPPLAQPDNMIAALALVH